ncbi:MAG: hypothetical protein ACJAU0_001106 [Flavobacteriales bacterium]|jgi:hypothetical protein
MRSSPILRFLLFSNLLVLLVFAYTFYTEFHKASNILDPINAYTTKLGVGASPFVISMIYLVFTYFKAQAQHPEDSEILDDIEPKEE